MRINLNKTGDSEKYCSKNTKQTKPLKKAFNRQDFWFFLSIFGIGMGIGACIWGIILHLQRLLRPV